MSNRTPGPQDTGYHVCTHGKNPAKCRDCAKTRRAQEALNALAHGPNKAAATYLAKLKVQP